MKTARNGPIAGFRAKSSEASTGTSPPAPRSKSRTGSSPRSRGLRSRRSRAFAAPAPSLPERPARRRADGARISSPPHHGGLKPRDREIHHGRHQRQDGDRGHHDVELEDLAAVLDQVAETQAGRLELADHD